MVAKKNLGGIKTIFFLYISVKKRENTYIYIKKIKMLGNIKKGVKV